MAIPRGWARFLRCLLLCAAVTVSAATADAQETAISWNPGTIEEGIYMDAPLQNVLQQILKGNDPGVTVVFREVQGVVNANLSGMLRENAFNKLLTENDLSYVYDPTKKVVTVSRRATQTSRFVTLKFIDEPMLRQMIKRFEIAVTYIFDGASRTVKLSGLPQDIENFAKLITEIDAAETARREDSAKQQDAKAREAEAEAKIMAHGVDMMKVEVERERIQERRDTQVAVFPLRYSNVSASSQTFQGETVSVPGIDVTLRALLGLDATGGPAAPGGAAPVTNGEPFTGTISTDPRSNAVIVRGTKREIETVKNLLTKLDVRKDLVDIEVMIVQASDGAVEELGLRWGGVRRTDAGGTTTGFAVGSYPGGESDRVAIADARGAGGAASPLPLISPLSLLPDSGAGTIATFLFRGTNNALSVQLSALEQKNEAQILNAPRVVTLNNVEAKITADQTSYIPTIAGANSSGGYLEVKAGLTLKITPSIIYREDASEPGDLIRLTVNTQNTAVNAVGDGSQRKTGNEIVTQAIIPSGATFVMGGLLSDTRGESVDKVPLLGDIPLLGELFKVRNSQKNLGESLFFITPRIVRTGEAYAPDVAEVSLKAREYLDQQRGMIENLRRNIRGNSALIDLRGVEEDE